MSTSDESKVPPHVFIDPGAASTEHLKQSALNVGGHTRFWTKALVHGYKAVGARYVRSGFSFSEQMDLAWALGFPEMRFVIDGFSAAETLAGIRQVYDPEDLLTRMPRTLWSTLMANTIVQPYRAAVALVREEMEFVDIMRGSEEAFNACTSQLSYDAAGLAEALRARATETAQLDRVEHYLEALLGPDLVAEALLDLIEKPVDSPFGSNAVATNAAYALVPLARRLLPEFHRELVARMHAKLAEVNSAGEGEEGVVDLRDALRFFVAAHQAFLGKKLIDYDARILRFSAWIDDLGEHTLELAKATTKVPQVPAPRMLYAATDGIFEVESRWCEQYDARDMRAAYLNSVTTINHSAVLGPALRLLDVADAKSAIMSWLSGHAEVLVPTLKSFVAAGGKYGKSAQRALTLLNVQ